MGEIQVRPQNVSPLGRRGKGRQGLGSGWLPNLAWGPRILPTLPAHSPSFPPALALGRSMLPLLTAENRACNPPPPPPLRLAVSPEILPEKWRRVCCGSASPWGRACGGSVWFGHRFRLGKREGGPANANHHLAQGQEGEGKGPASSQLETEVRHRELFAGEGCS